MRRATLLLCAIAGTLPALGGSAAADVFEPIQLASASPTQQADYAHDAAISGDGRFVAFDGSFGGLKGIWRRDLLTGVVTAVIRCPAGPPNEEPCAELPSISEDGRYVSFTSTAPLDPRNDSNRAPDVYVRDMNNSEACTLESGGPCEFTLASAVSGSSVGLSYLYGASPAFEETHYGSLASGRSALSADGRHVVFVTTAESDLAVSPTPKLEVAMRNLDTRVTQLVSVRYDTATGRPTGEPVPATTVGGSTFGAVYPGGSETPVYGQAASAGAAISADGSTVAWMGQQIERQAPLLSGEPNVEPAYTEPLWRRIADGPNAPTRRVTGGGDPASPACAASGEASPVQPPTLSDPCQGPFDPAYPQGGVGIWNLSSSTGDYLPRLSGDGRVVAFLSSAREIALGEAFVSTQASDDLYVADMRDGLTRVQALRRLTEIAGGSVAEPGRTAPILDLSVSRDGSQVAFSSQRTVFPLGSPAYISAPAAAVGMVELFDVDLANDTLTRITHGYSGEPSEPSSGVTNSPSFSADGNVLAFSSTGSNLVYGDGNAPGGAPKPPFDGGDAFLVRRRVFSPEPAETYLSPAPPGPALSPAWVVGVTARSRRDGSVLLAVTTPDAGALRADAVGGVVVSAGSARATRGRRAVRPRPRIVSRTVASALASSPTAGVIEIPVKLARHYQALAGRRGGFSATLTVTFSAPGHAPVHRSVTVSFVRAANASRHRAATHGSKSPRAKARR